MKVGTDSTLIGALSDIDNASTILDIGSGTGIVELMLAQRSKADITGIELDELAAKQANENISATSWKERINIVCGDFIHYHFVHKFDCIVSNPPFFKEDLRCPDNRRNMARHTDSLPFEALLKGVSCLLNPRGRFSVIIPTTAVSEFIDTSLIYGLFPKLILTIYPKLDKQSKRTILILTDYKVANTSKSLVIHRSDGSYSDDFREIMRDYYLHL
jgi:tRNA1Val (adenine37-N6)-methyltransferase